MDIDSSVVDPSPDSYYPRIAFSYKLILEFFPRRFCAWYFVIESSIYRRDGHKLPESYWTRSSAVVESASGLLLHTNSLC